jgi:hypothetical protein
MKEFDRMHRNCRLPFLLLTMWAGFAGLLPVQAAPYAVKMEPRLRLDVRPLTVQGETTNTFESRSVTLSQKDGATLRFALDWPGNEDEAKVELEFRGRPSSSGKTHGIELTAVITVPGEKAVTQSREILLEEQAMRFVEIYARGDIHFTLALELDIVQTPVVLQPSGKDRPVEFTVEIVRVSGGESIDLETDTLRTFLNEPVSYSFRRGADSTLETLHLELLPLSIDGNVLKAQIRWDGEIRTGVTPLYLSRSETIFTSRAASSEFQATAGEPPEGYSFKVTPRF